MDERLMRVMGALRKPKTIVISTRADARTLASILVFFEKHGFFVRSQSELATAAYELVKDLLNLEDNISTEQALEHLARIGLGPKTRNFQTLARAVSQEREMEMDSKRPFTMSDAKVFGTREKRDTLVDEALETMQRLEKEGRFDHLTPAEQLAQESENESSDED